MRWNLSTSTRWFWIVPLSRCQPKMGTLDAIHLATALLWRESTSEDLAMATYDRALALGAQARGLRVLGATT